MVRAYGLALLLAIQAPSDTMLRGAALVKQLTGALAGQKLDSIAAQDPSEKDRFIAARFYPDSQLLVVSARSASPAQVKSGLEQRRYREVYADLHIAAIPQTTVFFQDMKADGLCATRDQVADIVYEQSGSRTVFDADWRKHDISEEEYRRRLTAADEAYSKLLEVLLAQLREHE